MRMGDVAALRIDGPAEKAGDRRGDRGRRQSRRPDQSVKLPEAGGTKTWFAADDLKQNDPTAQSEPNITVRKLDPVLLPLELKRWADGYPQQHPDDRKVKIVVLRSVGHEENKPGRWRSTYDPAYQYDREIVVLPNIPPLWPGLGWRIGSRRWRMRSSRIRPRRGRAQAKRNHHRRPLARHSTTTGRSCRATGGRSKHTSGPRSTPLSRTARLTRWT